MIAFDQYFAELNRNIAHGDATEHTHRHALKALLESIEDGIVATNEPKRILCGAPDFNITKGNVPLGHVETKDLGAKLDAIQKTGGTDHDQFVRYRDGLLNWILTNYIDFHWYVNGQLRLSATLGRLDDGTLKPMPNGEKAVAELLRAFVVQQVPIIGTAKELAERMAGITRIIRDLIRASFENEIEQNWLQTWLSAFREVLIPEVRPFLTDKERAVTKRPLSFDDMFAQTLAYGLFAARIHIPPNGVLSREAAAFDLPKTNPFLRKLFSELGGIDMPETVSWAVDDLIEVLNHTDLNAVLKDFGKGKGKEDPVFHFYEDFLKAYDAKLRKVRGVYYTPAAVVSYIIRTIDHLLTTRFEKPKGLADENVLILDPATGTATFLYFIVQELFERFRKQRGSWNSYVGTYLLNRIFGFELLMAPYAIAHLKLGRELQETGYTFASDQRLGIYLTNTLEEATKKIEEFWGRWIAEEANSAADIKKQKPIMVITGNPPYSASVFEGAWIMSLLADYKKDLRKESRSKP